MFRALADDLLAAFQLLTRLPVDRIGWPAQQPDLKRLVWAYPVVGALIGAIGALAYWIAAAIGCPPILAALWSLVVLVLATGAFHEDGLADMADGFGGGATRERKLEIMRDSRIGSYGVIALVLAIGIRAAAISLIADPAYVAGALVAAGAASRGSIVGLLLLLEPARADGLAAEGGGPYPPAAAAGLGLALVITIVFAPAAGILPAIIAAIIGCLAVTGLAKWQIGGYSGDVLGAAAQVAECLVLTALIAAS